MKVIYIVYDIVRAWRCESVRGSELARARHPRHPRARLPRARPPPAAAAAPAAAAPPARATRTEVNLHYHIIRFSEVFIAPIVVAKLQ